MHALRHPVDEATRAGIDLGDAPLVIADDPPSFPAVSSRPDAVVTVHYAGALDLRESRRPDWTALQLLRAERVAVRRAGSVFAYSERVAAAVGHGAVPVPIAMAVPASPEALPEQPVAAVVGDLDVGAEPARPAFAAGRLARGT